MKNRVLSGLALLSLTAALVACSDSADDASNSEALANCLERSRLAASSTRVFNDELKIHAAELGPPVGLLINNAGSSTLVQQVVDGAPGDVLITADEKN